MRFQIVGVTGVLRACPLPPQMCGSRKSSCHPTHCAWAVVVVVEVGDGKLPGHWHTAVAALPVHNNTQQSHKCTRIAAS